MALEKKGSPFDSLPPETIARVFASLPGLASVLAFGSISRRFRDILKEHESFIARGVAATILRDDDPGVLKLAFMSCEAKLMDNTTVESVREFLQTYVTRNRWPARLYRLRVLPSMRQLSLGIELSLDWITTYAMPWPVKLQDKLFTDTEASRHKRLFFILEALVNIFGRPSLTFVTAPFRRLMNMFWDAFSIAETNSAVELAMRFENHAKTSNNKSKTHLPWRLVFNHIPRGCVDSVKRIQRSAGSWSQTTDYSDFVGIEIALQAYAREAPTFETFSDDPNAAWAGEDVKDSPVGRNPLFYVDPRWGFRSMWYYWFFETCDKDRIESVIQKGRAWSWDDNTVDGWEEEVTACVMWHQDPDDSGSSESADRAIALRKFFTDYWLHG